MKCNLKKGRTRSCGCLPKERSSPNNLRWNAKDLTGKKFGKWTVIGMAKDRKDSNLAWDCLCECGSKSTIGSHSLLSGTSQSCGCSRAKNIAGEKFGRLTALYPFKSLKYSGYEWDCVCECGRHKEVLLSHLKKGVVRSCGCLSDASRFAHGRFNPFDVPKELVEANKLQNKITTLLKQAV